MRVLRALVAASLALSLVAVPGMSAAQSEGSPAAAVPRARQPEGRLPLAGTPWRLVGYTDGGREAAPGPEVAAFIEFGPGSYRGSGGCSRIEGDYAVTGSALLVRPGPGAERSCAENLAMVQRAVENGLRRAAAYEIQAGPRGMDDALVIRSVSGAELLRYSLDHAARLDGSEWRLGSYTVGGQTVPASATQPGLLSFRPDSDAFYKRRQSGPLAGSSGCNGIVAQFFRHSDVLSFGKVDLTDAPCTDELAAQQAAMVAVLDASAVRLDLPADRLVLTSADTGERLEFVSRTPLEGTTWWLQRTTAGDLRGQRVTLRLEAGEAAGEGPCGAYRGTYLSDGVFITFTEVEGAGDAGCSESRTERALIGGLRRAVRIARSPAGIALLDAAGAETLAFDRPVAP